MCLKKYFCEELPIILYAKKTSAKSLCILVEIYGGHALAKVVIFAWKTMNVMSGITR